MYLLNLYTIELKPHLIEVAVWLSANVSDTSMQLLYVEPG